MNHRFHSPRAVALLLGVLLSAVSVRAQLGVALSSARSRYLRYEPIELTVTLRNYSGNTLTFGKKGASRGYVFFLVESHAKRNVKQHKLDKNPADGLILNAGETKTLTVSLNDFFNMQNPGSYTVRTQAGHARLDNDYQSEDVTFEVRDGQTVLSRDIGLPGEEGSTKIEALKVSLIVFQDMDRGIYCLRVEDDEMVYATIRLGRQIASSKPEMDADGGSDIHLLLQVSARLYSYQVYSLARKRVKLRQERYYIPDNGVPRLTRSPGYIKVVNGKAAVEGVDYKLDRKQAYRPKAAEAGQ